MRDTFDNKKLMNDKSVENFVTNIVFNTQPVNCHTIDSDYSDCNPRHTNQNNKCLISDSPLHLLITNKYISAKDHKLIKDNNLKVIKRKFTKREVQVLKQNWDQYCDDYECDVEMKLRLLGYFAYIGKYTKEDRKQFQDFVKSTQFLLRLANGLPNRTIKNIYYVSRTSFKPLKRMSEMSVQTIDKIKQLHTLYGNKWSKIGEKFMCTPYAISNYYHRSFNKNGEPYDKGKWSPDENKRLLDAMRRVLNTDDLKQYVFTKNIPYNEIKELAEINRSSTHVALHWYQQLRWSVAQWYQLEDHWTHKDCARLVYCLFRYNFTDESDIDWDIIKEKFANISSFNALMRNWRLIKQTVPLFESKSYKQIIDFLYDNLLPQYLNPDDDGLKEFEIFVDN
ncbi:transcription termination factor 1-like [Oppia nitens]|uniref:transcription termination factor 1-like n=1 Tax=Oppia nitens TaxID=1686743 RepID=UPI0023DAEF40|nr:transcription termination factor 1-like [Oppia nitens]